VWVHICGRQDSISEAVAVDELARNENKRGRYISRNCYLLFYFVRLPLVIVVQERYPLTAGLSHSSIARLAAADVLQKCDYIQARIF
jgi:hypothetical protein